MKSYIIFFVTLLLCNTIVAQNTFTAIVKDTDSKEPLIGVSAVLKSTSNGAVTDINGVVSIKNIPNGEQTIEFSYLGYEKEQQTFTFPMNDTIVILMENAAAELNEVVVSSTRSSRSVANIPTRIEFIGIEELGERANMEPGDIRMMLSESTGIQTQQTSPTSGNASIRIQGLDGRYTQILKDGMPLYSGAASGLGLLQIPPLDLKQVEIIKGSTSTLYGGGAIAGLINLISKTPTDKRELSFLLNGTSALGLDFSGYYSQKFKKTGLTLFAASNSNAPYEPYFGKSGLSAIPKVQRYTFNPRLFVYFSPKTKMDFGVNTAFENRTGGDMLYLKGKSDHEHSYFERNETERISTQFSLKHNFSEKSTLNIRNSYNHFQRKITIPNYLFSGVQNGSFSEINYSYSGEISEWVTGVNLWTDNFKEKQITDNRTPRDYNQITTGLFVQNLTKATEWLSIESGLRGDYVADYGFAFLPRLSALFKFNNKWTSRIGGGLGYKTPTIFTEESETLQYRNVLPIDNNSNKLEHSYGANADVNYRTMIADKVNFSINQLFFYTYLNSPLMLVHLQDGNLQFQNINGHTDSKGAETNIKIGYDDLRLFLGYTFTNTIVNENGNRYQNPLTPKHRVNITLMYEIEDKWRAGLETYYCSRQRLNDGDYGRGYWTFGAMVERIFENFSIFANFENFTDTRQTRFGSIYTGTITNPTFKDIYAPLDGFVVNAGIKIKL